MPRAQKGAATRQAKARWFKQAKGYRMGRRTQWRRVKGAVVRAGIYATRDRRRVKREYRELWILRINAAVHEHGLSYSRFIAGLKKCNIALNRKMLSEIAIHDPQAFALIIEKVKAVLPAKAAKAAA